MEIYSFGSCLAVYQFFGFVPSKTNPFLLEKAIAAVRASVKDTGNEQVFLYAIASKVGNLYSYQIK
ncbi:MAG: hypothetical protein QNJ55_02765 [Xenococcus sp. MO_188.B8]|nr:hypothetical protein [Xenococcus sp. MO_188.B8]